MHASLRRSGQAPPVRVSAKRVTVLLTRAKAQPLRGQLYGDDRLGALRPIVGTERVRELLLELAVRRELLDDIRTADQLALDEDLRDRRPTRQRGELLAN